MYTYSMTQWIAGNEDLEQSIKRLKKYGYDGIEFAAEPHSADVLRMPRLLEEYQMKCTSLCGIYTEERDLTAPEGERSEAAVRYLCGSVDLAVQVKAPYIIIVPSPVGRTVPPEGLDVRTAWENAVKNVRRAAGYAEKKGIRFAVEAVNRYETYLVNTMRKAVEFVEDVDHPAVGLMADLFHMSLEENDMIDSIYMAAPYLMHVHIADHTREAAGMGGTDFKAVLHALKNIGYKGPLTMEFMPRVANPYEIGDLETKSRQMDLYAWQSIEYLKGIERVIEWKKEI